MTQEEKAKAYDEAIERAKSLIDFCSDSELKTLEFVFPELAESEDERIRKELINFVENWRNHNPNSPFDDYPIYTSDERECNKILAWLEKQGEQKPAWSEEDEFKITRIVAFLENLNVADNDILIKDIEWLKSFKERIGG